MQLEDILAAVLSPDNLRKYQYELAAMAAALLYMLFYLRGERQIRQLAKQTTRFLWQPESVLLRNFVCFPGTPEPGVRNWKESVTLYRQYASGRRYCQYALFTLDFKARQDLLCQLWYTFQPRPDVLHVDVCVGEGLMPPTVFSLAAPKVSKALVKSHPGLKDYTKSVQLSKERANGWADCIRSFTVLAEQPSVIYDIFNAEPAIARAFASKWFRSAVISSEDISGGAGDSSSSSTEGGGGGGENGGEGGGGSSSSSSGKVRHQLQFEFALPPPSQQEELNQLLRAVFLCVDLLATYKASPEMRKRAQELRAKLEQEAVKRISASRQGHLAQKRSERLEADRARARAAGPQALAKFEERLRLQNQKRDMRKRTVKM